VTPCARGCCWSPFGCALARECDCHWGDWLANAAQTANNGAVTTYRDPTANTAIANADRGNRRGT